MIFLQFDVDLWDDWANCAFFSVARVTSPLVDPTSIEKLLEIDCHLGRGLWMSLAGLLKFSECTGNHRERERERIRDK